MPRKAPKGPAVRTVGFIVAEGERESLYLREAVAAAKGAVAWNVQSVNAGDPTAILRELRQVLSDNQDVEGGVMIWVVHDGDRCPPNCSETDRFNDGRRRSRKAVRKDSSSSGNKCLSARFWLAS